MLTKFQKGRILWPILILILELAAYAQNKGDDKNYIAGHLQSPLNNETSGIAASSIYNDIYYIHNDSGDTSRFFAITPQGKLRAVFLYHGTGGGSLGVKDCEDIAVGPGPEEGSSYIYIADIGDNDSSKPFIAIYRSIEPSIPVTADSSKFVSSTPLYLKYPDGAKDAETLMIDPLEKLFYIVTKRSKTVSVYTAPLNFTPNDTVTLTKRTDLRFRGLQPFKWIVSGDISKDGSQILLKSYSRVYYWKRNSNEPVWQTLQRKPQQPPYEQERLGEAIGFAPNGKSYYTVSEGSKQPIYHYGVPKS
jgi:hypothetical protein